MDTQSRKYQITVNSPEEKGVTHEVIAKRLHSLKSLKYYCMSDEIGDKEHRYHTHIFVYYANPKLFSTMKKLFPESHIESARGTCVRNRQYVMKEADFKNSEKGSTSVPGTQEEYGELPEERACPKPELELLFELIKQGFTNYEILEQYPEYMFDVTHIDRCRLILRQEEYKNTWRDLEVTYIFGKTGAGKTRYVMEKHGYANVFRVTDYKHPFDTYNGESVILYDEFNSSLNIQSILMLTEGYPLKLPARYTDKIACFTNVYFCTNIRLEQQYPTVYQDTPTVYDAFVRRIQKVMWFKSKDEIITYNSTEEYFKRDKASGLPVSHLENW